MNNTPSKPVLLLVDSAKQIVYDISPVADIFNIAIGRGNLIADIKDLTADLAFNLLQIASQNKNETLAENIMEAAYDVYIMRSFDQVKPLPDYNIALSQAFTIENMACRTDQQ